MCSESRTPAHSTKVQNRPREENGTIFILPIQLPASHPPQVDQSGAIIRMGFEKGGRAEQVGTTL